MHDKREAEGESEEELGMERKLALVRDSRARNAINRDFPF